MATLTRDQYIDSQKLLLLQQGGVHYWDWYEKSISDYEKNSEYEIDGVNDLNLLYALESNGVNNWSCYGKSLGHFFDWRRHVREHWSTGDYMSYDEFVETLQDD